MQVQLKAAEDLSELNVKVFSDFRNLQKAMTGMNCVVVRMVDLVEARLSAAPAACPPRPVVARVEIGGDVPGSVEMAAGSAASGIDDLGRKVTLKAAKKAKLSARKRDEKAKTMGDVPVAVDAREASCGDPDYLDNLARMTHGSLSDEEIRASALAGYAEDHGVFAPGVRVVLLGLLAVDLNGAIGTMKTFDIVKMRFAVALDSGRCIAVYPRNIFAVGSRMHRDFVSAREVLFESNLVSDAPIGAPSVV